MGKKTPDVDVPDPLAIIEAQKEANRTGTVTPFGSTTWQGDNQVTEFGPQMGAMSDRMFNLGMQDSQRAPTPEFMNDIASALANRVGERYGLEGVADKPAAPQAPPEPGPPNMGPPPDVPAPPPNIPPPQAPSPGAPPPFDPFRDLGAGPGGMYAGNRFRRP